MKIKDDDMLTGVIQEKSADLLFKLDSKIQVKDQPNPMCPMNFCAQDTARGLLKNWKRLSAT